MSRNDDLDPDDELTAMARTLHREWDSPALWATIAHRIAAEEKTAEPPRTGTWPAAVRWGLAAAATVLLTTGLSLSWLGIHPWRSAGGPSSETTVGRTLLSDPALADIEAAEAQYTRAIEQLSVAAADRTRTTPDSPLLAMLRERLVVIDAAIAECRAEIERNRFNAHLRRHLLAIYQEKRRTLEQILELESHAS